MAFTRHSRIFAASLALCAILLNAGWPLLAKAKSGVASPHDDICTSTPQSAGGGGKAPAAGFTTHCAFCSLASDKVLPPMHTGPERIESSGGPQVAKRGAASNQGAPHFSPSTPRGPPVFS